jgi:hypothetical protein
METLKTSRSGQKKIKDEQQRRGIELTSECDFLDMFIGLEEHLDLRIPDTLVLNGGKNPSNVGMPVQFLTYCLKERRIKKHEPTHNSVQLFLLSHMDKKPKLEETSYSYFNLLELITKEDSTLSSVNTNGNHKYRICVKYKNGQRMFCTVNQVLTMFISNEIVMPS